MTEDAESIIAGALGIDASRVDGSMGLAVTPEWDSLAHFRLVLAVEDALQRKLDPAEIVSLTNLASVAALIQAG